MISHQVLNDIGRFTGHVSVVFETSHPVRPVFGHDGPGGGPGVGRVESAMPLEPPQFLQANLVRGEVHEQDVNAAVMAICADASHAASECPEEFAILLRGRINRLGPNQHESAVH